MPIEFDCEGCGDHVISFGMDKVPRHGLCGVCAWACEFIDDPQEMIDFLKLQRRTPNEKDG